MGKKSVKKNKRGQITIFIIVALVIIALGILIYMFFPKIKTAFVSETESPYRDFQICLEQDIKNSVQKLSLQGGSINPEHYIVYNGENVEYLCYTNEYYKTCVVQQPMLKNHVEKEIEANIRDKVRGCFDSLEKNYKDKGYEVNLQKGSFEVELLPKRVLVKANDSLTLTKEKSDRYDKFVAVLNNNLYELISITNSIIEWEARYGDSETTTYMNYYQDLKVEKKEQIDGSTVYMLTDRNNGNKFQFASRSVAWPPGYGT